MIAVESGMDLPEFFMDKTFSRALHFNMSTSQVGASNAKAFETKQI